MNDSFYSVRMRVSSGTGLHLGGAERLVQAQEWVDSMESLLERALAYSGASEISLQWDPVSPSEIERITALAVVTFPTGSLDDARREAARLLVSAGVSASAAAIAMTLLDRGPGPAGAPMRGGLIMEAATGTRLEPDPVRGVRATRMDYTPACRRKIIAQLENQGLTSHRVWEAVAVATKAAWSGALAELGWSDDPRYVAGYVSGPSFGYCRFNQIKELGVPRGGRVFFLEQPDRVDQFMERMEQAPLLIDHLTTAEEGEKSRR